MPAIKRVFLQEFEDIHCLKRGEKAKEAFAVVYQEYLEYFEKTATAESQIIVASRARRPFSTLEEITPLVLFHKALLRRY